METSKKGKRQKRKKKKGQKGGGIYRDVERYKISDEMLEKICRECWFVERER